MIRFSTHTRVTVNNFIATILNLLHLSPAAASAGDPPIPQTEDLEESGED